MILEAIEARRAPPVALARAQWALNMLGILAWGPGSLRLLALSPAWLREAQGSPALGSAGAQTQNRRADTVVH